MVGLFDIFLQDAECAEYFTIEAEISAMLAVEIALLEAQSKTGFIEKDKASHIVSILKNFTPNIADIQQAMVIDGVAIPQFVKQLRQAVGDTYSGTIHKGATSQDIIDSGLMLRLKKTSSLLHKKLTLLLGQLQKLQHAYGQQRYIAHTRMQIALPILVKDKLDFYIHAIHGHINRLDQALNHNFFLQTGGAAGNNAAYGVFADKIMVEMAKNLDLLPKNCWQTDRSPIMDIAQIFNIITGTMGKIGQDIALMAQNEIAAITVKNAGTSSAMPHKQNPIKAEIVVAIARIVAGAMGTLSQAMIHENERSGAAWAIEWAILPEMAIYAEAAIYHIKDLCDNLKFVEYLSK